VFDMFVNMLYFVSVRSCL